VTVEARERGVTACVKRRSGSTRRSWTCWAQRVYLQGRQAALCRGPAPGKRSVLLWGTLAGADTPADERKGTRLTAETRAADGRMGARRSARRRSSARRARARARG